MTASETVHLFTCRAWLRATPSMTASLSATCRCGLAAIDVAGVARILPAGIGDEAASLAHQQHAGGQVPALQPELPEAVVAAGGDPGEVERRGTEAADAGDLRHQHAERAGEGQASLRRDRGERDAGGEHRILQLAPGGDAQAPLVDEGADALLGPEHLIDRGGVDQAGRKFAAAIRQPPFQPDADRPVRNAVQEVGGAVERIDHPAPRPVLRARGAGFLHQEGVAGTRLVQFLAQRLLGAHVGLRDEVGRALHRDLQLLDLVEVAQQPLRRLLRRVGHHRQVRGEAKRHGGLPVSPWRAPRSCRPRSSPRSSRRSR